jgi:hypothetical protein
VSTVGPNFGVTTLFQEIVEMGEETGSGTSTFHPQPQSSRPMEFITFTNPETARNAINRQRIRRQVMRDFHKRLDSFRRRSGQADLATIPSLQMPAYNQWVVSEATQHRAKEDEIVPDPVTPLGVSRLDPFFKYPVRMGYRERELCDHRE